MRGALRDFCEWESSVGFAQLPDGEKAERINDLSDKTCVVVVRPDLRAFVCFGDNFGIAFCTIEAVLEDFCEATVRRG